MTTEPEIHARLDPSPFKRWIGLACLVGAGIALIYSAARVPGGFGFGSVVMLATAAFLFWAANKVFVATSQAILLTDRGLVLDDGTLLAAIENIERVERGIVAFIKPSNGFGLRLREAQPGGWSPGLWWCSGRVMGLGGATNRDQARFMAQALETMLNPPPDDLWPKNNPEQS